MNIKEKKCKVCGEKFTPKRSTTERHCSFKCAKKDQKTPKKRTAVKKISEKRSKLNPQYSKIRKDFLDQPENKFCKIKGSQCTHIANTIEHRKGRRGYADDWARENGIPLLIDIRFFLASCSNCNQELERNPELSKLFQLSKIHQGKKI